MHTIYSIHCDCSAFMLSKANFIVIVTILILLKCIILINDLLLFSIIYYYIWSNIVCTELLYSDSQMLVYIVINY